MSRFFVRRRGDLFGALQEMFAGRARRDLRRLLRDGRIRVNGEVAGDASREVQPGDVVECGRQGRPLRIHPRVELIYEDRQILVVEKGIGILTAGGVSGHGPTVRDVLSAYLGRRGRRARAAPCHRLDRDVSGLLCFARDPRVAAMVRSDHRRYMPERVYYAVVEGTPAEREGRRESFLEDRGERVVEVQSDAPGAKAALTRYRVLRSDPRYAALEVRLDSGRKHQIRAHLSAMGHPIAGDRKYGARSDPARRIALHATRLALIHPSTGERLEFDSPAPTSLLALVRGGREPRSPKA